MAPNFFPLRNEFETKTTKEMREEIFRTFDKKKSKVKLKLKSINEGVFQASIFRFLNQFYENLSILITPQNMPPSVSFCRV